MRVKRYLVDSMPDALHKIRTDLGKNAVIINTKEIRTGGFLGLFSKKKIEVIAAMDTSAEASGQAAAVPALSAQPAGAQASPAILPSRPLSAAASAYSAGAAARTSMPGERPTPEQRPASVQREMTDAASPAQTAVPAPAAASLAVSADRPAAEARKEREDLLLDEIKQMRSMMLQLSKRSMAPMLHPVLEQWQSRLQRQELEPQLVDRLIDGIREEAESSKLELTDPFAAASLRGQLLELLPRERTKPLAPETKVAHFVGPTGVGKTTTIAKLAAEQVLKHQRKVGFITSDTYRIAAVDQLKTYATILNIPLEVVFSPLDLGKAFEQLQDRDIIFMDTAGRNFRNEMYVSELNALLQGRGTNETFLVLSMTTKYNDMKAITQNFSRFNLDKVLFTKMDETASYGAVINLLHEFPLQLSYMTTGQNVPDDIVEADEQRIVDWILEAGRHE